MIVLIFDNLSTNNGEKRIIDIIFLPISFKKTMSSIVILTTKKHWIVNNKNTFTYCQKHSFYILGSCINGSTPMSQKITSHRATVLEIKLDSIFYHFKKSLISDIYEKIYFYSGTIEANIGKVIFLKMTKLASSSR